MYNRAVAGTRVWTRDLPATDELMSCRATHGTSEADKNKAATMLTLITILKTLVEVAGLALLGQGVLYLFAGANRERNFFYRILKTITQPVWRFARVITPRVILDRHIGFVAFLLLGLAWYLLVVAQAGRCLNELGHPSCERLMIEYVKRCEAGDVSACDVLRRNAILPTTAPAR